MCNITWRMPVPPNYLQTTSKAASMMSSGSVQSWTIKTTLCWWKISDSSFPGPFFFWYALLRRLEEDFPQPPQVNKIPKCHSNWMLWRERKKSWVSLSGLTAVSTLIQGLETPSHSTVSLEEKSEVQVMVNSCEQNVSLWNCKPVLISSPDSQRTFFTSHLQRRDVTSGTSAQPVT